MVDLYDSKLHIAIEYVSADDFYVLGGTAGEGIASYGPHNHHSVASNLAKAVSGQNEPIYFGTFYDPVQWWTRPGHEQPDQRDWHYSWEDAESASRELLRRQVEDFIEWLKGQGVI